MEEETEMQPIYKNKNAIKLQLDEQTKRLWVDSSLGKM